MGCDKSSRDYLSYRQGDKRQAPGNKRAGGSPSGKLRQIVARQFDELTWF